MENSETQPHPGPTRQEIELSLMKSTLAAVTKKNEELHAHIDRLEKEREDDLTERLVSFGNYLLSERRRKLWGQTWHPDSPKYSDERVNVVSDADIRNWEEEEESKLTV